MLAVGQALGIPESDVRHRIHGDPERMQREFRLGEEELYGELMESLGVFDAPKQLDGTELLIAKHLRTAWGAMGGMGSGHALGLSRWFVTGELASVFRSLARSGPRAARGRPADFWEALVSAGELLEPADRDEHGSVAEALAAAGAPGPLHPLRERTGLLDAHTSSPIGSASSAPTVAEAAPRKVVISAPLPCQHALPGRAGDSHEVASTGSNPVGDRLVRAQELSGRTRLGMP
ncbi:hypothetical protein [Kitasatospora sp. NPDC093806]|uniref:hypothetical protein n=1 Tax=Kitasatospora sp. NPDC093806 TaxID=3155075 RepID=UPI00341D0D99